MPTLGEAGEGGEKEEEEEEEEKGGAAAWVARMKRLQQEKEKAKKRVSGVQSWPCLVQGVAHDHVHLDAPNYQKLQIA